jgi:hypothetical protein
MQLQALSPRALGSGTKVQQYWFGTRSLLALTNLNPAWYTHVEGKWVKVVPFNIAHLLTPMGLAHWIQGDGFWDRTPGSADCNDTFTEQEGGVAYVELAFPPPCFSSSMVRSAG